MAINPINVEKCVGCGTCVNACPMDVFRRDFNQEEVPPCAEECPAHIPMREYMHLVTLGQYEDAIDLILTKNPLFAITGHVCFHSCEQKCARNEVDEPVNINGVERYLGELMLSEPAVPVKQLYASKIAIVGSGPAGLAAAFALTKKGYPVTVFEADDEIGGMLRTAIPEYRMPTEVLDKQIKYIADTGVSFETGKAFGSDITIDSLKADGFEVILLATGAPLARVSGLEGEDLKGVYEGLDFAKAIKKNPVKPGDNVIIIGGGNTAIDTAMSAKKAGAEEVTIVYRRMKSQMPASAEEIAFAEEEGIIIMQSLAPSRIVGEDGKVTGVEFVLSVPNENVYGGSRIILDETKKELLSADAVIFAAGEETDLSVMPENLNTEGAFVATDKVTLATNIDGVFAAGTVGAGSKTVTEAIGSAMEAVESIDRYIKGADMAEGRGQKSKKVKYPPVKGGVDLKKRLGVPTIPVEERKNSFAEIKQTLTEMAFDYEASRCMGCGSKSYVAYEVDCQCCEACEWDCPYDAIYVSPEKYQDIFVTFR